MKKNYSVLIIDDHPLITEAYKNAFRCIREPNKTFSFHIAIAHSCDAAYNKIKEYSESGKKLDIVLLDINLPPSKDGKILSGEDLGMVIRKTMPNTKIIVSTMYSDNYRINTIFKNLDPDSFLIKGDITPKELVNAINATYTDTPYYSKTIIKQLRKEIARDIVLDAIDRKLLFELSIGSMMIELPSILKLSLPAIEKRKSRLKRIFNAKEPSDKKLIKIAKKKGFI